TVGWPPTSSSHVPTSTETINDVGSGRKPTIGPSAPRKVSENASRSVTTIGRVSNTEGSSLRGRFPLIRKANHDLAGGASLPTCRRPPGAHRGGAAGGPGPGGL